MIAPVSLLTARELEVVCCILDGVTTRNEIAHRMKIHPSTVRAHLAAIFLKMGVEDKYQVVLMAVKCGMPVTWGKPMALALSPPSHK